jgi:protein-S-isoprenylcysteine O-methyltransferase Ste14
MTDSLTSLLRIYLPLHVFLLFVISFMLPSFITWKKNPPVNSRKDASAYNYLDQVMKALFILLFANVVIFALGPQVYLYLVPVWYFEKILFDIIGLGLIHISLVWIMVAQYQVSNNWKIGTEDRNKTLLVKHGLFRISRNPVFAGIIVSMLGLFLILPNVLSFFLTVCTYIIIQLQVRFEEDILKKDFGKEYEDYKSKTRRWI